MGLVDDRGLRFMLRDVPDLEKCRYIDLSLALELGRGNKRVCFEFPGNRDLCIKIAHRQDGWKESVIEWAYVNHLKNRGVRLDHCFDCFGWVKTNFGPGLIVERILNDDGSPSSTLSEEIRDKIIEREQVMFMFEDLRVWAVDNCVAVIEPNGSNLAVKKIGRDKKIVMIDGVGGRERLTLKNYLYLKSRIFSRFKARRKFKCVESLVEKEFERFC